jgi:hypothetical protein
MRLHVAKVMDMAGPARYSSHVLCFTLFIRCGQLVGRISARLLEAKEDGELEDRKHFGLVLEF